MLCVEQLESRDCPSTMTLNATVLTNNQVQLSGTVSGDNVAGLSIEFSGAAAGSVTTDSTGYFTYTTSSAELGMVIATGVDDQEEWFSACSDISSTVPMVDNVVPTPLYGTTYRFCGTVVDEHPEGLRVTVSGIPSIAGQYTTVRADGTWEIIVTIQSNEVGLSAAFRVTDWWGLESEEVFVNT